MCLITASETNDPFGPWNISLSSSQSLFQTFFRILCLVLETTERQEYSLLYSTVSSSRQSVAHYILLVWLRLSCKYFPGFGVYQGCLSVLGDNAFILSLLIVYSDFGNLREVWKR